MSSECELDDGIKAIKSAWRREHTARRNLEKMLENAEAENATLRQQLADVTESMGRVEERCAKTFEVGKRWMAKAARFEAENAKLRDALKHREWIASMLGEQTARVVNLQELVREMFDGMCDHDRCNICPHWQEGYNGCEYYARMRGLGIEVEECTTR